MEGLKVSLFATCLVNVFYPNVGKSTYELLTDNGCEVDVPLAQTCCGQPAFNSGYKNETKEAAIHLIKTFNHAEYVVTPSGSCATMLHEYPHLFKDDLNMHEQAIALKNKTYELTDFLVNVLKVTDLGVEFPAKATYHSSCHMTRLLGVKDSPHELLSNVKGLEMIDLPGKETCCGFGGTFSVKMKEISKEMVSEKVQHVEETGANVLIGSDCGCLMNIGGRISHLNKDIKVMHISELLTHQKKGVGASGN